jgi:hypothetical protein
LEATQEAEDSSKQPPDPACGNPTGVVRRVTAKKFPAECFRRSAGSFLKV